MIPSLGRQLFVSLLLLATLSVQAQQASPRKAAGGSEDRLIKHVEELGGRIARDPKLPEDPVVEIDLNGTKVTDGDLRMLSNLAELRTLNLHRTGISDEGIEHLLGLKQLTTLTLGDTRITNTGLKTLTKLEQLQFIGLHGTLVDDAGVKHLMAFPHLKSLFLSKSGVTDEGLKSVKSLVDLELLWLAESHITDAGLAELETLSGLKSLSLEKTTITDQGLVHLAGLKELVYLDVRGTKVTAAGLSRLTSKKKVKHLAHDFPRIVPGVTIAVGERVPELSAIDLQGQSWKFAQLHRLARLEKPVPMVLTFWCSFCPSCRQVERDLDALAKKYAGKAIVVALDSSAGETAEMCRKVADEKGLTLPILLDGGGHTADVFGSETTTTTVVIDASGVLRYCGQFIRNKERCAEVALEAILNGKPVAVPTTPHLGCPIVRTKSAAARERFADAYADAIQTLLQDKFAESNSGMVIGLLDEHGSRVFSAGKLDNGSDQKVDGDTVFELGSVTKVVTALLLLDAVRRGEMKLDDPLSKYLPEQVKVPAHGRKEIKLLNLAAQDSGLPWHPNNLSPSDTKELSLKEHKAAADAYTIEKMYEFLSGYQLGIDPGAEFQYSNVGMALLGNAIERKTSSDYETLVVDRICRPLKMDSTRITLPPALKARLARGHWVDGSPSEHLRFQAMAPAGSLLSTANDLLKFLSANLGFTQTDLTPMMDQMQVIRHTSPRFGKTAMPWFDEGMYIPPGSEFLAHGGGGFGNLAFIALDTKKRRGVFVLTNQMNVNPNGIGWTILQGMPLTWENITFLVREIEGIGIGLDTDQKTGLPRIMTVYPKSPAGEAGLSVGLVIQKINGTSVEGKSLKECLGMMGGPVGTKVRLELFESAKKEAKSVELARQKFLTATGDSRK